MTEQAKFGVKVGEGSESDPLVGERSSTYTSLRYYRRDNRTRWYIVIGIAALVVLAIVIIGVAVGVSVSTAINSQFQLANSIKVENLMRHLEDWEEIAERNENSRAVMYGYNETGDMVYQSLMKAGYQNVSKQYFKIATFQDNGGHSLSATGQNNGDQRIEEFELGTQFSVLGYSGATVGNISGSLALVTGCEESDFSEGSVALIDYNPNDCPLFQVAQNAKNAGVSALLIARTQDDPNANLPPRARVFSQTLDDFEVVDLPMLGMSYPAREILDLLEDVSITLFVNMNVDFYDTYNVLCYTDGGRADSIIVMGSHLDSVPAGPGINDNGSGSGANLEIALQLISSGTVPENKILFAFWGAEEWGLLGSNHFVKNLPEAAQEEIALNLNFDMIGSPNFIRGVYNGSGAENQNVVDASTVIQELFEKRFDSVGLAYKLVPFNGRSDYGPFIEEGVDIPAGGLFTGAEELKSVEDQMIFGGLAGAPLDPCYHKLCDDVTNVDLDVYEQMSQAAASVLSELMMKEDLRAFLKSEDYEYDNGDDEVELF